MSAAVFSTMDAAGVRMALDWARDEGWNPGIDDGAAFFAGDAAGFFQADVAGTPVAVISVVNHSADFAFLGLYIARPEYRGSGIGLALWTHALEHAGGRTVGLDGVPDQQDNYRKSGFEHAGETHRFSGEVVGAASDMVRPATADEVSVLADWEAAASGYGKPVFLGAWLSDTNTRKTLVLDRGGLAGFATIRACGVGHKIGPLIANTVADAAILIRAAAHAVGAATVILDVPDACPDLMAWCRDAGLTVTFNTARMYRGVAPQPGPHIRAVATLELG